MYRGIGLVTSPYLTHYMTQFCVSLESHKLIRYIVDFFISDNREPHHQNSGVLFYIFFPNPNEGLVGRAVSYGDCLYTKLVTTPPFIIIR